MNASNTVFEVDRDNVQQRARPEFMGPFQAVQALTGDGLKDGTPREPPAYLMIKMPLGKVTGPVTQAPDKRTGPHKRDPAGGWDDLRGKAWIRTQAEHAHVEFPIQSLHH